MTTLNRVLVSWAGPQVVGLAANVLHFSGSDSAVPVAAIRSAYAQLAGILPAGLTITVPTTGDQINDTTGDLVGVWNATGGGVAAGSASASAAAGVGACVSWQTGGIVNGRRLRGRTFIVPLARDVFDGTGKVFSGSLTSLEAFATALQASGPLAVWHRPTSKTATDGNSYGVISHRISPKVAFLSSRRD